MPSAMDLIGPVFEILKYLWVPLVQEIKDLKNLKKNIEKLKKEARELFIRMEDVNISISSDTVRKIPTKECIYWIKEVKELEDQLNACLEEYKEEKTCFKGCCPNVSSRRKLGKRVKKVIKEIAVLKEKSAFKGGELIDAPLEKFEPKPAPEVEASTSPDCTLHKILESINDVEVQKIGIWGMGGVGKTTVMKLLNNQPKISQMFEIVIWVTVSRDGNLRKVQSDIAERLRLVVSNESHDRVQAIIHQHLSSRKFLLLLDDVWERMVLSDVGIPDLNQHRGSKVVLTTRSLNVCHQMDTDKEIKVEVLSDDEAWSLFHRKVGDAVMLPRIKPIARSVVEECDGLPLAIIVVGASLRRKDDEIVWRNALKELRSPTTCQLKDMEEQVFRCLRFSYDQLQDECVKRIFLYSAMYPEDYEIQISEMVEYCCVEGFIDGVDSIVDARDKGHSMIVDLMDASLLEGCGRTEYVKMHDVIRDLALRISSSKGGHGFLVKAGTGIDDPPKDEEWEQSEKISLMNNELQSLPERPNCPILSTLMLQKNYSLTKIPESFFELMPALHVLDLSGTCIKSLPLSTSNLVRLRGLYLKECPNLEDLPSQIGALKLLEVFHLGRWTKIKSLPVEFGELSSLKCVFLTFARLHVKEGNKEHEHNLKVRFPVGIISKLPSLEELSIYVEGGTGDWQQWHDESMKVVVNELSRLEHLSYLDFYFPNAECLEQFLRKCRSWKAGRLTRFRFRVGNHQKERRDLWGFENDYEVCEGCLIYRGGAYRDRNSLDAIGDVLGRCCNLILDGDHSVHKFSELGLENMNELKHCLISNCYQMETLVDVDEEEQKKCGFLPNLLELEIQGAPNLSGFWVGPVAPGTLSSLTTLSLMGCAKLKNVFSWCMIPQLSNLESLTVSSCPLMEEIVVIEEEMLAQLNGGLDRRIVFPKLKRFLLSQLPELVHICQGFSLPFLKKISVRDCPKLKSRATTTSLFSSRR